MSGILGHARVSTGGQDVAGQTLRLIQAGAIKVFTDVRSGRLMDRPGLSALLDYARKNDTLAVVRLDRLERARCPANSMSHSPCMAAAGCIPSRRSPPIRICSATKPPPSPAAPATASCCRFQ